MQGGGTGWGGCGQGDLRCSSQLEREEESEWVKVRLWYVYLFIQKICWKHTEQCALMFSTHLSMTPLGARGSSHSSWAEREVRVTGRGGGWWAGGAARVWSSLSGPWLQHCQKFKTETSKICSISDHYKEELHAQHVNTEFRELFSNKKRTLIIGKRITAQVFYSKLFKASSSILYITLITW